MDPYFLNTCYNNNDGISLHIADNNNVTCNIIYDNSVGMWIGESSGNSIIYNTVNNNEFDGINLYICTNCLVRSNSIFDNYAKCIQLEHSSNNVISSNTIRDNGNLGVAIAENFPEISNWTGKNCSITHALVSRCLLTAEVVN